MSRRRGLSSINLAWAIPVLAVATLTLGAWGWLERGIRPDEALYRAMILFDNGNDLYREPPGSTAWQFMIGRWTGAISLFGAGVLALGALAHERFVLALARMTRQEVVIIGGEDIALKAFDATRQARKSVVWIGAPTLEAVSFRSLILPWPPDDHVRTIACYVTAADHVLIAQSDDAGALVLARAAPLWLCLPRRASACCACCSGRSRIASRRRLTQPGAWRRCGSCRSPVRRNTGAPSQRYWSSRS